MVNVTDEWKCKRESDVEKSCSEGEVRPLGLETDRVAFVISLA